MRSVKPSHRSMASSRRAHRSGPSPTPPRRKKLKDKARQQLDVSRKLIAGCGYHRRDRRSSPSSTSSSPAAAASPISRRGSEAGAWPARRLIVPFPKWFTPQDSLAEGLKDENSHVQPGPRVFGFDGRPGRSGRRSRREVREKLHLRRNNAGCSCDAPGVIGLVCATPYRCIEMSGLCVGGCTNSFRDDAGCSCDAPGINGLFCATPRSCREMSGLCTGGC